MDMDKVITRTKGEIRQIDLQVDTLKARKKSLNLLIRKLSTVSKHAQEIVGDTIVESEELKEVTSDK